MDESRAATAASHSALRSRWRTPWLSACALLLVLAFLTANVLGDGPLVGMDHRIRGAVLVRATSVTWRWLAAGRLAPARALVHFGDIRVAVPVLAVSAGILSVRRRSVRPMLAAAAGVALLVATVIPAKIVIARPAPGRVVLAPGGWGAFPSGHSSTSAVCLVLAVLMIAPELPAVARRPAVALAAVLCVLVGAALVWCDDHWCTDVVAGWALAAIVVQVALPIARPRREGSGNNARALA